MGLFDSDYKAKGSVSVSQIGQQRDEKDTFIGDLVQQHPTNGRSIADEIRYDLFDGVSATYRKYERVSDRNNFETRVSIKDDGSSSTILSVVNETHPNATKVNGTWGPTNGFSQALSVVSNNEYKYSLSASPGIIAIVTVKELFVNETKFIIREYVGSNNNLFFDFDDGEVGHDTGVLATNPEKIGYFGIITEPPSVATFAVERRFYWFSTDKRLNIKFEAKDKIEAYGCVSLQDNGNNERPYYTLKAGHKEYDRREATMSALGVDFEKMSKEIFDPTPIPAYGSKEWNEEYGEVYRDNDELKKEYATERIYHDSLVNDQREMKDNIKNITDVHFGLFTTPDKLDIANAYAMKAFFKDLLPPLPSGKGTVDLGETQYGTTSFDIASGSLKISHTLGGYKFGRRIGSPSDYKPSGVKMHIKNKGKVSWGVTEQSLTKADDSDLYDDGSFDLNKLGDFSGVGAICIATTSISTSTGQQTYEFIEIYEPSAKHHIDVLHDGEHGTSQVVDVSGSLLGIGNKEEPYSDVLLYPLTVSSLNSVPFFMRERLMRESTMLIIDGIQVTEVKWYQKGIFKIIFFVAVVVISCYLTACTSTPALLATFAATTVKAIIVSIIIQQLLLVIDDPILAAILVVVGAVLFGNFDVTNLLNVASLAVEATGTYMQKKFTQEMIEMEDKMKELRKKYNDLNEQMDEMMEAAGMDSNVNKEYALNKMTLPPPGETADDYFDRALNNDLAIINQDDGVAGKRFSKLPNYSKYNN